MINIYKAKKQADINTIVDEKELAGETLITIQRIDEPLRVEAVFTAMYRRSENRPLVTVWYQIVMRS